MANALIGALRVDLTANTSAFEDGMKKADRQARTSSKKIESSFAGVKAAAAGMVAGLSAAAIFTAIKGALEYASSLGEVSQQLGVTTKDLQTYRYAASQVGVAQEEMDKGLSKLSSNLGKVKLGSGGPAKEFEALSKIIGVDIVKTSQTAGDAIPKIADALNKITDPAQRAALEVALFGKAGQKLDTLLAGGSKAVNELSDAAERLGLILSPEQIKNADDAADKFAAVKQVLEADISKAVADNATAIMGLANALGYLAQKAGEGLQNFSINRNMSGLWSKGNTSSGRQANIRTLLGSQAGRDELAANTQNRLAANNQARQTAKGQQAVALDREFKALNSILQVVTNANRRAKAVVAPTPGGVDLAGTLATHSGGKSAAQLEAERRRKAEKYADDQDRFYDDEARNQADILAIEAELTHSYEARLASELSQIDADQAADARDIMDRENLSDAQRELLLQENKKIADGERAILRANEARRLEDERQQIIQDRYDLDLELAGYEADQASTAAERRDAELRILDLTMRQERAKLEATLADEQASASAKADARNRLSSMDTIRAGRADSINRGTMGPLESYLDGLPDTAAKANEALQSVAAEGLQSLTDGLTDALMGTKSLGEAFRQVASQIIADLIRIQIQQMMFGGGGGGGGFLSGLIGGLAGSIGSASPISMGQTLSDLPFKTGASLPGFAVGGSMLIGGNAGYDTNLLSINGSPVARVSKGEGLHITPNGERQGGGQNFHFAVNVSGAMNESDARRTGAQIAAEAKRKIASAGKTGF